MISVVIFAIKNPLAIRILYLTLPEVLTNIRVTTFHCTTFCVIMQRFLYTIRMTKKHVLFNVDGVLTQPHEPFSVTYCRQYGLNYEPFNYFFMNNWADFVLGKKDLKQEIATNRSLWQWDKSADELLKYWFELENKPNEKLLSYISTLRDKGYVCSIATEQEKYRGRYIKSTMFRDMFDHYFITSELGILKSSPKFYETIAKQLGVPPTQITFFDDSSSKILAARSAGIDAHLYTCDQDVMSRVF